MPGPELNESEWQAFLDVLWEIEPRPDYIVASGSLPPGVPLDFYARVAQIAKDQGSRLIVDTSEEALRLAVMEQVYMIKPNVREIKQLIGLNIRDEMNLESISNQLLIDHKIEVIVISLGAAGALLTTPEYSEYFRSPAVPIVSKIGAGDSMVAGIVPSLARGQSLKESILYGISAGAATVMTPGNDLCHGEDVEKLYRQMTSNL